MSYLFWKVSDTLKGFLLCLITNYRLIFLWKAQIAAILATTPPPFQYVKSLLKSKTRILFRKKNIVNFTQRELTQRHMICYETALWIENYWQIQNGGHDRPKWCNNLKTLKNDVLRLLECMSILQTGSDP